MMRPKKGLHSRRRFKHQSQIESTINSLEAIVQNVAISWLAERPKLSMAPHWFCQGGLMFPPRLRELQT